MTTFYLMMNNSCTTQENPEPGEWVKPLVEADMHYLEYFADHMEPVIFRNVIRNRSEYLQDTLDILKQHDIEVVATTTGRVSYFLNVLSHPYKDMRAEGLAWCKAFVDQAVALGGRFIAGHYDYICESDLGTDPDGAVKRIIDGIVDLSKYAAEQELEGIFLEQMHGPSLKPYTIKEGQYLIGEMNKRSAVPIYMHLDTGHMAHVSPDDSNHTDSDKDPYQWMATKFAGMDKVMVHLQQSDRHGSQHWPFTPEFNEKGIIVADEAIESIENSGVEEAYCSFEVLYSRGKKLKEIIPDMVASAHYFREAFRRCGYVEDRCVFTKAR